MDENAREQLRQANLTIREMSCLALVRYDGFTIRAAAQRLGMPRSTVADHIAAGERKLEAAGLAIRSLTMDAPTLTAFSQVNEPELVNSHGRDVSVADIKARW